MENAATNLDRQVTDTDITAERRIIESLGCTVAAWSAASLVVQYHDAPQRAQLIGALKSLGWLYPVEDAGDMEAMLLDIRRENTKAARLPAAVMESAPAGLVILSLFVAIMLIFCIWDIWRDVDRGLVVQAIISGLTYIFIVLLVLYTGLQYVTLKITLLPQQIVLANSTRRLALNVSDIQACAIESYQSEVPYFSIVFKMRNGKVYRTPAPFKGFNHIKDELRKRYSFSVTP